MRISIIGHAGSGKTTFAKRMSELKKIPHLEIDRLWIEAGGHKLPARESAEKEQARAYVRGKVSEFVLQDAWVSDGWYSRIQPLIAERADEILFLDISFPRRLVSHLHRTFSGKRHPEMTRWDDFRFIYQMIRRTFVHGPKMRAFVRENAGKVTVFRSYTEIDRYLADLK